MTTQQNPDPNAFNGWTETESATLAPPPEAHASTQEVPVKKGKRAPKPPMGKKQKVMLFGGGVLALVVALTMMGEKDPPPASPSVDVAAIIAQTHQGSPENVAETNTPFGFEDVTPGVESIFDPTLSALNAELAGETLGDEVSAEVPAIAAQDETMPVPPITAPLPAAPASPAVVDADTPPTLDAATRRRIEGLEGDLKRAQDARRVAERNQRVPVTVVAVLDDGVVVRDARGREKVFAVGDQVKL